MNLFIVLPIALPGIVTGVALLSGFERLGIDLSLMTLVVAHATFCVVIVFNNVVGSAPPAVAEPRGGVGRPRRRPRSRRSATSRSR